MTDVRMLRRLAREMLAPLSLVEAGLECGLFAADEALEAHRRTLRRARRLMRDLGVNPAGAALILRLRRDVADLQAEVARLRRRRALHDFDAWLEGVWRELEE